MGEKSTDMEAEEMLRESTLLVMNTSDTRSS